MESTSLKCVIIFPFPDNSNNIPLAMFIFYLRTLPPSPSPSLSINLPLLSHSKHFGVPKNSRNALMWKREWGRKEEGEREKKMEGG